MTNQATREMLPNERQAVTKKFSVGGHDGYITVGLYPDGRPGELFITVSKGGSTISGLMDCVATVVSIALQHGVPVKVLVEKLAFQRFEPSGHTGDPDQPQATSLPDFVARWMARRWAPDAEVAKGPGVLE